MVIPLKRNIFISSFKLQVLFYTLTKALGQRFDNFSSLSPRFIVSLLPLKQSSCFSNSLRIGFTIYYVLPLMCPILNLRLHCNSCYIPQFIFYLSKILFAPSILRSLSPKKASSYSSLFLNPKLSKILLP